MFLDHFENNFLSLPGWRMIKTSLAVFCCCLINYLSGQENLPFYAIIASILCIQQHVNKSLLVAGKRVIGTLLGGLYGIICSKLIIAFQLEDYPLLFYCFLSLIVMPLIYSTILLKQPSASYITCVVFFSIILSQTKDADPVVFAFHRIIETFMGILVALIINLFPFPKNSLEQPKAEKSKKN